MMEALANERYGDVYEYVKWRKNQEFWKQHKERRDGMALDYYNNEIEKIAKGEHSEKKIKEFHSSSMTKGAFKKLNYISQRVCNLSGKPLEAYFFLINKLKEYRNGSRVINDIYIGRDQNVTTYTCGFRGSGEVDSFKDIKENLESRIIGWAHSHGYHMPFHSSRDNENIESFTYDNGNRKNIELANIGNRSFNLDYFFSPSIVVNANHYDPYFAIAVRYPKLTKNGIQYKTHINRNCFLELVNGEADIDRELIDAQLLQNVWYRDKRLIDKYSGGNIKIKQELLAPISDLPKIVYRQAGNIRNKIIGMIRNASNKKSQEDSGNQQ